MPHSALSFPCLFYFAHWPLIHSAYTLRIFVLSISSQQNAISVRAGVSVCMPSALNTVWHIVGMQQMLMEWRKEGLNEWVCLSQYERFPFVSPHREAKGTIGTVLFRLHRCIFVFSPGPKRASSMEARRLHSVPAKPLQRTAFQSTDPNTTPLVPGFYAYVFHGCSLMIKDYL